MGFLLDSVFYGLNKIETNHMYKEAMKEIWKEDDSPRASFKDTEREEQQKIRKERFKDEIFSAIEVDKQNESEYSEEFYQQISQFTNDLYGCIDDFLEKTIEKYSDEDIFEYNEISEVYASNYGSGCYDYERESKAKVSCKEAIKSAINDIRQNFEEEKNNITESCEKFLDNMEKDINKFIQIFQDSFEDYISLDCEGEAEDYVQSIKDSITDGERILKMYEDLDIIGKFHSFIEEVFDKPTEKLLDVQTYFTLCEYDSDDDLYCYIMDNAIKELNEKIDGQFTDAYEELYREIRTLYQTVLSAFASNMTGSLIMMVQTTKTKTDI